MFFLNFEKWVVVLNLYCPLPVLWTKYEKKKFKNLRIRGNICLMKCQIYLQNIFSSGAVSISEKEKNEMGGKKNLIFVPHTFLKGFLRRIFHLDHFKNDECAFHGCIYSCPKCLYPIHFHQFNNGSIGGR